MRSGDSSAMAMWAGVDLRRRWRSMVLLGVLVGLTAGVALAALVGAFQNGSAYQRLRVMTVAPDVTIFASQRNVIDPDWDAVRAMPEVEQLGIWHLVFGSLDGSSFGVMFGASDGVYLEQINRPVVIEGRMWDRSNPLEVVVTEDAAEQYPLGSTMQFQPFSIEQLTSSAPPPTEPGVTLTVVGVIRTVNPFVFTGQAFLGPGFFDRFGAETFSLTNADVVLTDPEADMPILQRVVNESIAPGVPLFDINLAARRVETTLSVERTALLLLAAVVLVVGGVIVAQAVTRSVATVEDEVEALRALGMTTSEITRATCLSHLVMVAAAAVTMWVAAIGMSDLFPIGLGRNVYPDVGMHIAWRWLLPASVVLVALTVAGTAAVAVRSTLGRSGEGGSQQLSVAATLRRLPVLSIGIGSAMAIDPGQGTRRVPVRGALVAGVLGVAGVMAVLLVGHAVDDTLAHPERAGQIADVDVGGFGESSSLEMLAKVRALAGADAAVANVARLSTPINGLGSQALALRSGDQSALALTLVSGRRPATPGEIALGPETARRIGVETGDEVVLDDLGISVRVVGLALFPPSVHYGFDEGAWLSPTDFEPIAEQQIANGEQPEEWLAVSANGDPLRLAARINQGLIGTDDGPATVAETPLEIAHFANVRVLPRLLAGFLVVLATLSLAHALSTTVHRRRHEFAVLRALGFERRSTRLVVNAQSTMIGVVGLAIGIPFGIVAGRRLWRSVCEATTMQYVPPVPSIVLVLALPVVFVLVNLVAWVPARRVARMRLNDQFRTE